MSFLRFSLLIFQLFFFSCDLAQSSRQGVSNPSRVILDSDFQSRDLRDVVFFSNNQILTEKNLLSNLGSFLPKEKIDFKTKTEFFWIYFPLTKNTEESQIIFLSELVSNFDLFDLYLYREDVFMEHFPFGNAEAISKREIKQKPLSLKLILPAGKAKYHFFIKYAFSTKIPNFFLSNLEKFNDDSRDSIFVLGIYYGIMFFPILLNLTLFYFYRDRALLFYTFYLLSLGLNSFRIDGLLSIYLFPDTPRSSLTFFYITPYLIGFFFALFVSEFLKLQQTWKKGYQFLKYFTWFVFVTALIQMVATQIFPIQTQSKLINSTLLIQLFLVVSFFIFAYLKKIRNIKIFILAWTPLLSFAILYVLFLLQIIPTNEFTKNSFKIGNALEMVLLTVVLGGWVNKESKLKKSLQKRISTIEWELDASKQIQQSILPKSIPTNEGYFIDFRYIPMMEVGGDFIDFLENENGIGILIADVTGHGLSAAMISLSLKLAFSQEQSLLENPTQFVKSLNANLFGKVGKQLLTLNYSFLEFKTGRIKNATAGHPPLLLVRRKNDKENWIISSESKGPLVGARRDINPTQWEMDLQRGDRLLFYTDGLTERMNSQKQLFEEESMTEVLKENFWRKEEYVESLILESEKFADGQKQDDDIAIVFIEVL